MWEIPYSITNNFRGKTYKHTAIRLRQYFSIIDMNGLDF